ncbi:gliding motility-associated C-terminal domain-containing protein [Chitinophagaceae bacterium MMS25-I14]
MKKINSLLYVCIIALCAFLLPQTAKASHCAGGELTYTWLHDSTYQFTLHFYRDCSGTTVGSTFPLCYYSDCGASGSTTMSQVGSASQVSTGCPGVYTTCNGGSIPGYEEYVYTANLTMPSRCVKWTFYTYLSARNPSLNLNPDQSTFYIDCTMDNLHAQGLSSPYFSVKPVPYVCINKAYTYNNGAIDPNNDSLAYEMIQPRTTSSGCQANPSVSNLLDTSNVRGYGAFNLTNNPFSTGNTFSLNATNGQIAFTPNLAGAHVITIKVKKYRNSLLIGTVLRDIQVRVLSTCSNVQPTVGTISSTVSGATLDTAGRIMGCAGQTLAFCFDAKSSDTDAKLVITTNSGTVMPGSTLTLTNSLSDSVRACFNWTPGILDTGVRNLIVTVKDSSCKPPGILLSQSFIIPIYISPVTQIFNDTTICPGDTVHLTAVGGTSFSWSVLPGGSPLSTLSCTNCKSPIATPTMTTRYVVSSNNLSYCNKNKDTVTIVVVTPPVINAGPDTTTCVNNSLQLNINLPSAPGTSYAIQWTPNNYLSNPNIANPVMTPAPGTDIVYYISVIPNGLTKCMARDTLSVRVLQGYKLYTPDTAICKGQSIGVNLQGDSRYAYSWTPVTNVSNPSGMAPTITPDTSRLYTVTASYPGCRDSVSSFYVDVQPVPTVYAGPDQILCYGDTMTLGWTDVTPSSYPFYHYDWNPGGALDDGTLRNPLFTAYATATLVLTVTTPAGCSGNDDITLTVKRPDFMQVSSDTSICPGDTAHLHTTGTAVSLVWTPNSYISDTSSFNPDAYPVVSTAYTVIGKDVDGCKDTAQVQVTVKPMAVITLPDSATIYPGDTYQLDPQGNCLYFQWFPSTGLTASNISNPVASPAANTRYFVTGKTEFGCTTRDSIDIYVSPDSYVDVPNAFSPGSAPNAILKAVHRGNVQLREFRIFNRWGAKMFETADINQGWDGTLNGQPQPMGVYVYVVEAVTPTGRVFYKQGNVTLIR